MRTLLVSVALAFAGVVIAAGTVSAQVGGVLDQTVGDGQVNLPGGGGVNLPGGGDGAGVDLPGGGGVQVGGGGASVELPGGGGSVEVPDPTQALAPPDDGTVTPAPEDGGSGYGDSTYEDTDDDGTVGPSGTDGRGGGAADGGRTARERERARALRQRRRNRVPEPDLRRPDGIPTSDNPTITIAPFGPAPVGVPNFVIDQFAIPPFLLPIYQACGTQYGIPWQVLASINRIETAFGTNLNVSTAGALGWMQFMPSTWRAYGVDANNDGRRDPYNPVDAICAAARYLRAAGGADDLESAIFAYNHADWYVDEVLLYAREYGRLPDDLVGSLTGLTEGARFPVAADARYADDLSERRALERANAGRAHTGNAADVIAGSPTRRGINIYSREGARVIAVNDGVIREIGRSKRLGRYVVLEDAYGNRFTYAELGRVSDVYPVPEEPDELSADDYGVAQRAMPRAAGPGPVDTEDSQRRLFARPPQSQSQARLSTLEPADQVLQHAGYETFKARFGVLDFDPKSMDLRPLEEGSKVVAGTVLGELGKSGGVAAHVHFEIQPAGRGAPSIDPKSILDGWKLLEATHLYRAAGEDPFEGTASAGQVLLLSKEQAMRQLLASPDVELYECGRRDVRTGQIDSRVMKLLLYLAARGFRLTVTSLKCGHSVYTSSGNISQHSTGGAVDIAEINGLPVLGNQGDGTVTEALIREVLTLQGSMVPDQVISLMEMGGPTFAMGDHADHVHVGYAPLADGAGKVQGQAVQVLERDQWRRLIDRIDEIENPEVPSSPSEYSLPAQRDREKRASYAHSGE